MDRRLYRTLRKRLERDYAEKLLALDRLFSRDTLVVKRGELTEYVKSVISGSKGSFSVRDVQRELRMINPIFGVRRASISRALGRLAANGGVEVEVDGAGKRPTQYRRA
jgi:DNA-binding transcriptional ArsR family regulator